jgi:hypothetical protein
MAGTVRYRPGRLSRGGVDSGILARARLVCRWSDGFASRCNMARRHSVCDSFFCVDHATQRLEANYFILVSSEHFAWGTAHT